MTRQEKFSKARKSLQLLFPLNLSFEVNYKSDYYLTEIFVGDAIISVGAYHDSNKSLDINDRYLESMLIAIANYDPSLIPE